jgi:hypothetical protein
MADRIDDVNNSGSSSSPSNVVDQDTLRDGGPDGGSNSGSKKRKLDAAPADAPANACRLHPYMNAESSIKKLKTSKKSNTEEDGDDGDDGGGDSILCVDCKKPFPTLERNRECTNPSCTEDQEKSQRRCFDCTFELGGIECKWAACTWHSFFCCEKCTEGNLMYCISCGDGGVCQDCGEGDGWKEKINPKMFAWKYEFCPECQPSSAQFGKCKTCGEKDRKRCANCSFQLCVCLKFHEGGSCEDCGKQWCTECSEWCVETCEGCGDLTGCNECVEDHMMTCEDCNQGCSKEDY